MSVGRLGPQHDRSQDGMFPVRDEFRVTRVALNMYGRGPLGTQRFCKECTERCNRPISYENALLSPPPPPHWIEPW